MNYDIHSALEQLQKSLEGIDSAKQQVERVAKSYDDLHGSVDSFVRNISEVSGTITSLIQSLQNERLNIQKEAESSMKSLDKVCATLTANFNQSCNDVSTKFSTNVGNLMEQAKGEVSNLHTEVKSLEGIHSTITQAVKEVNSLRQQTQNLLTELTTSQSAQDEVLAEVSVVVRLFKLL